MKGGSEMYNLQEDMEYQQVYEDPKIRVYMSLVRSDEERLLRAEKARSERNKRKRLRWAIIAGAVLLEAALTMGSGIGVGLWLMNFMEMRRGYVAIGSEIFIGPMVAVLVAAVSESLLGGVAALENELH